MHALLRCPRCDWIDHSEGNYKRCPECGSRTESAENLFAGEIITCVVKSMRGTKNKVPVTFEGLTERFNKIVTDTDLTGIFDEGPGKDKINFMMRAYIWRMLKRQPQLWQHITLVIKGLKELMVLKQLNQK